MLKKKLTFHPLQRSHNHSGHINNTTRFSDATIFENYMQNLLGQMKCLRLKFILEATCLVFNSFNSKDLLQGIIQSQIRGFIGYAAFQCSLCGTL